MPGCAKKDVGRSSDFGFIMITLLSISDLGCSRGIVSCIVSGTTVVFSTRGGLLLCIISLSVVVPGSNIGVVVTVNLIIY